jgi:energy-coupling factor transporter ATP-binding protein EcfA2
MHIVVYGPTHSGKSTFTASLYRLLEKVVSNQPDLTIEYTTLDLWDNAGPWLLDDTGEVPKKRDPDDIEAEINDFRDEFANLSGSINLADAPGKIDEIFRELISPSDGLILLISEEKIDEKDVWVDESEEVGISLLSHFISYHSDANTDTDLSTIESYFEPDEERGQVKNLTSEEFRQRGLVSLGRETERAIRHFATHLVELC